MDKRAKVDREVVVSLYRKVRSLRVVAQRTGISMQRVHQIIKRFAPDLMRAPHVYTVEDRRRK